jgi:hypothetical protein
MKFKPQVATWRASCKRCNGVIPKGQPCLELVYGAGAHTQRDKVCLPCLTEVTGAVRNSGDYTEPVLFDDKGLRDFIQDNFAEEKIYWINDIHLTDKMIEQFKRHLEADISYWISENWKDFTQNRGD